MKLLLLEDDEPTRAAIREALEGAGHAVEACGDGREALSRAQDGDYAALVLDRMVPGMDGLSVLRRLRADGVATPALLLTAMADVQDRVDGLEGGADDYLVKPFATIELVARVRSLLRRPPTVEAATTLRVADLELDQLGRTVRRGGERIDLQPQEMRLLEYLMRHKGEVVTRSMILAQVWSINFDPKTNLVQSHISRLRSKIDRGGEPALIHTVWGSGYCLKSPP